MPFWMFWDRLSRRTVGLSIYLGIGAIWHALILGVTFQVANLWSWGLLLAWPAPLFVVGFFVALALFLLSVIIVSIWVWIEAALTRRNAKARREAFRRAILNR